MSQAFKESKTRILQAFEQILAERQPLDAKIATKEEEAERAKNAEMLERALHYSTDSIVRGLADLQLEFGTVVGDIVTRLDGETEKLDELQRAIATETERLDTLRKTRVVADALHLLSQEHQEKRRQLETRHRSDRETLEKTQVELRRQWQREQADHIAALEERQTLLQQERSTQEADYLYDAERSRQIALDEYETAQRQQERHLSDRRQTLERDWANREAQITRQATQLATYRQRADAFPQELETAIREAREAAIRDTNQETRIKADLATKDYETAQQSHTLQIAALEAKIANQASQIDDLSQQLTQAMQQAQTLALRAFETSSQRLVPTA